MTEKSTMSLKEKQFLALHARELITRLRYCEDREFAAYVVECVQNGNAAAMNPENIAKREKFL